MVLLYALCCFFAIIAIYWASNESARCSVGKLKISLAAAKSVHRYFLIGFFLFYISMLGVLGMGYLFVSQRTATPQNSSIHELPLLREPVASSAPPSLPSDNFSVTIHTPSQDSDPQNDNSGSYSQNGREVAGGSERLHSSEKESSTSKVEDQLAKEKERERIEQERLQQELKAENERQRIEIEKQRRLLAEEKEHQRVEQKRLRELEAEKERQRVEQEQKRVRELEAEKERQRIEQEQKRLRALEAEKERQRIEQEQKRLRELEAEKVRQRIEQERLRKLVAEKERERIEQERLRNLVEKKKTPCEKIQDSLDKRFLNYAIKKANSEMTVLPNKQGVNCYIIPTGIRGGCIEYQIEQEGSSALCFYKECTGR